MERISEVELEALSPVELIARLYRGAIEFIHVARTSPELGARHEARDRALAIVDSLQAHLDHESGGEVAANLDALYEHVRDQLSLGETDGFDAAALGAASVLERLGSGWEELAQRASSGAC